MDDEGRQCGTRPLFVRHACHQHYWVDEWRKPRSAAARRDSIETGAIALLGPRHTTSICHGRLRGPVARSRGRAGRRASTTDDREGAQRDERLPRTVAEARTTIASARNTIAARDWSAAVPGVTKAMPGGTVAKQELSVILYYNTAAERLRCAHTIITTRS